MSPFWLSKGDVAKLQMTGTGYEPNAVEVIVRHTNNALDVGLQPDDPPDRRRTESSPMPFRLRVQ
jgi:hypothetical protein